jgi:regulator of protease activity HflC (stomatin/prohibitin superfamily)
MTSDLLLPIVIPIVIFLVWLFNCLNIMREYERAVVFRLGRVLKREKGPGLVLILWPWTCRPRTSSPATTCR